MPGNYPAITPTTKLSTAVEVVSWGFEMIDRVNDIAWQAQQGSVAAIIQVLNAKLAKSGVRIRAIFVDGVLQLLCEASRVDQLEQSTLVENIRMNLELIAPRNIRRVKINSRIVREEQLLWHEEISRDSENQLLWSQEITLVQPNIIKQLIKDLTLARTESEKPNLPNYKDKPKSSPPILITSSLCILLLLGWIVYLQYGVKNFIQIETSKSTDVTPKDDPFAAAVRLANQASLSAKTALTSAQWLEIAATWQRASDLMATVSPTHQRYQEAKIRTQLYRKFSEAAQQEANKSK